MPAISKYRSVEFALVAAFVDDLRRRMADFSEHFFYKHRRIARHFLIWINLTGVELKKVDATIVYRFLRHDCRCGASCAPVRIQCWRKRRRSAELMRFVRFLERSGHVETPGELEDNLRLLDAFLGGMRDGGYAAETIRKYRCACTALIVWLHLSRIRLCELTPDVVARFGKRQFAPWIPGAFRGREAWRPDTYATELRGFLRHLAATGRIEAVEPAPVEPTRPVLLDRFAVWLENHRGIGPGTIRRHVWLIAEMMPELGDDPRAYDTALIRDVLHRNIQRRSRGYVPVLPTTMRMYLRFLATESRIQPGLVAAVPSVPQKQLSSLPRYIASDDVERAIATCGDNATGLRDRAILLLLARLALRAGDIVDLRLTDVDWDGARIRVFGKSRREAVLPLPQDAGDALHAYIATARPKADVDKVFLSTRPPWRGFSSSTGVGSVARRALDRAGIKTFAARGAHVFRHSQATALLRSGATLDVIQSLLRHRSPNTTAIYAKTDAVMLQEIAQCWIGGIEQ
ncbi:MAG: tyrosine-type recombinase/integrase [Gammaproteobacteria bacterium]|nr:tyrosine-type recombinase/integrase [Gammaproteobacteria bacterium]